MYKINDYIIYGGVGVCEIVNIGPIGSIGNAEKNYYTLEPIFEDNSKIYVPIDNDKIALRRIMSKEEADNLIKKASCLDEITVDDERLREQSYREIMKNIDPIEILRLIKTTNNWRKERLAKNMRNTSVDDKYLKMAKIFLAKELAITLKMSIEEAEKLILHEIEIC